MVIHVGLNATFKQTGEVHTNEDDIDDLFNNLSKSETKKLVLYFHGGLVNEENGLQTAERMSNLFNNEDTYTVPFVWKTGFLEILQQQLEAIYNSPQFQIIKKYVSFRSSNRFGRGGRGNRGDATLEDIEGELQKTNPFEELDEIARQEAAKWSERDLNRIKDQLQEELEADLERDLQFAQLIRDYRFEDLSIPQWEDVNKPETEVEKERGIEIAIPKLLQATFNVIKRHCQKRDHGIYPTIVEEILRAIYLNYLGKYIWDGMKKKAKAMWLPNQGEINEDSYVGTYFLEKLVSLQQEKPELIIDLVGHSAGAIAICHLLNSVSEIFPNLKIRNVLFMAPACTSDLFYENIVTKTNLYQNFRLFTMRNDLEIRDSLVPGIYTRSLLYFISGVLEDTADKPITGLEFHLNGQSPGEHDTFIHYGDDDAKLRAIRDFLLTSGSNRLVFSQTITANSGLNSNSTSHGDFDSDETTLESLLAIISS